MSITTSIILPEELNDELKHICVDEKRTKADWIREAIIEKLNRYGDE